MKLPVLPLCCLSITLLAASLASDTTYAAAQDDTLDCLAGRTAVRLTGNYGYEEFKQKNITDRTAFDARSASWRFQNYPMIQDYPVDLRGGNSLCWVGGIILGTMALDAGWEEIYYSDDGGNGAAFIFGEIPTPNFTLSGLRIHNTWDGIRPRDFTDGFVIKNVWLSHIRDDCIENDHMNTGIVADSLIDGCHTAFSSRDSDFEGDASDEVWTLQNNLVSLELMAGTEDAPDDELSHGPFFKWIDGFEGESSPSVSLKLYGNVFRAESFGRYAERPHRLGVPSSLIDCRNNVFVWLGEGDLPFELPSCFTVTKDPAVWEHAKTNWINCHPEVSRLPSDPQSHPERCDPNAYGGGGTAVVADDGGDDENDGGTTDNDDDGEDEDNDENNDEDEGGDEDNDENEEEDDDDDTDSTSCHRFRSGSSAFKGFGLPFQVLSGAPSYAFSVECTDTNANVTIGPGNSNVYIYKYGYEWQDGAWHRITYTGNRTAGDWIIGEARTTLSRSSAEMEEDNFFVGYACTLLNGSFKCGCQDSACTTPYWQLQMFRK